MTGDADQLLAHAFHQVAVGGDDIGVVIDDPGKRAAIMRSRDREADRGRDALPQRAGGRLHARRAPIFRMPGRLRSDLPELLEVLDAQSLRAADAGQKEQAVEQHAAVAARQDKPVAIGPMGIGRVEFQNVAPENRRDIGHAHRQAGMAALGLLHRIEGEKADRIGHRVVGHARRHWGSPQELGAGNFGVPSSGSDWTPDGTGASIRGASQEPVNCGLGRVDAPFKHRVNKTSQWMESTPPSDSLETSLKRLASAVDALEWATDMRMRHDEARATTQEEFALMQDDRSRLAVELDAAVDRSRALESANAEAAKRLAHAAQAMERVLGRSAQDSED